MDEAEFQRVVEEEWDRVPSPYRDRIENVALLVEDVPSEEVKRLENLKDEEMLLGIYQGVPLIARGEGYGTGGTLPDTITIYRLPTILEAEELSSGGKPFNEVVREVVRDTIWHELGHYFGHNDEHIYRRESAGTNTFTSP